MVLTLSMLCMYYVLAYKVSSFLKPGSLPSRYRMKLDKRYWMSEPVNGPFRKSSLMLAYWRLTSNIYWIRHRFHPSRMLRRLRSGCSRPTSVLGLHVGN